MKLPRDLSGDELVRGLRRVGYESIRQKGDHIYMTTATTQGDEHHVSIPLHNPVKTGTLAAILGSVAGNLKISRDELLHRMKV